MNPLIIGTLTSNLSWDHCKYWVKSINRSGYKGKKLLVLFGKNDDLSNRLRDNDFIVEEFRQLDQHEHVCVTRFFLYYAILQQRKEDFVIATDVTDVIFQSDPIKFLEDSRISTDRILASSENIRYQDEAWGAQNIKLAFGEPGYERVKHNIINNAGVIAGPTKLMQDLFYTIYTICESRHQHIPGGGGSDQAAYNLLLSTSPYVKSTYFVSHDVGWACQTGTVADPLKDYSKVTIDAAPRLDDGLIKTSYGKDFCIVHQYNRNPQWKKVIEEKYND